MNHETMLACYRALDLTDEKGFLCGKVLADLGADVIKIERPGGDPARSVGPFYHDIPDPERSLNWFAFNANKRGITLDIEKADGKHMFSKLVETADFLIESFSPGHMDELGIGYAVLSRINPKLIMISITPFGQEGPYRDWKGSDIVVWALSGMMYVSGEPDRPPLSPSFPHSYFFGAMQGAVGAMVALCHRHMTGCGQHVDASAQMSLAWVTQPEFQGIWDIEKKIVKRSGRLRVRPGTGVRMPIVWQCKDGDVSLILSLGSGVAAANRALVEWVKGEGDNCDILDQIDWWTFSWEDVTQELADQIIEIFSRFFLSHTQAELFEGAVKRGIQLSPSLSPKGLLEFAQLTERGYWVEVEHPELGTTITYPGAFVRPTETVCGIRRRAPLVGEHNEEIYKQELGFSAEEMLMLKQAKVI